MSICPVCQNPKGLINGIDSKQYIEYPPDKLEQFAAGELSLAELNEFAMIYYNRQLLCDNPTCTNFAGDPNKPYKTINYIYIRNGAEVTEPTNVLKIDIEKPRVVVETLKIKDE